MMDSRTQVVERALCVKLPSDYAAFLEEYGLAEIQGMEIYGYTEEIQDVDKIPCVIGATRLYGPLYGLQPQDVVLGFTGYEDVLVIMDTQSGKVHEAGFSWRKQVADSFEEWMKGALNG